jgi:hemolysin activation/secretion protein
VLRDKPEVAVQLGVDNTGARSTGSERANADMTLASPFGMGDQISASAIHTPGSDYLRLAYSAPVGGNGWRVGGSASQMQYTLVASEFDALDAKGSSGSNGLEASYPIVRSRLKNLYLNLNYDGKAFDNQSGGATTTRYKVDTFSIALNSNLFDTWGDGGANAASLRYVDGDVDLGGSPNWAADAATTQANGHFSKLAWSLSRQQALSPGLSLFGQWSGQTASKNLDSSERFYLGGANGVRAYPSNEGGGSEGQLLTLELRWQLPSGFAITGFYDYGQVMVNRDHGFAGAAKINDICLKGAGLALAWVNPAGVNLKMVWAQRDGDNPNPTAAGNDQDGTHIQDRVWFLATFPL